ncbi:MAG TPA: TolC family protein [Chitinispirillaceae bacterium]|nr:TolC family protein [Chitinispirillaceae bacterium]
MNVLFLFILCILGNVYSEALSLHDAQQAMFDNNSDLKAASLEINRMQYALKESRASLYPSLDLSGGVTYFSEKGEVTINIPPIMRTIETSRNDRIETGIDCSYPIFTGFARTNAIKGARAAIQQKQAALRIARNRASFALARIYCQMDFFTRSLLTVRKRITTLERHLEQVNVLRESGVATTTQVLEVKSKLLNTQVDLAGTLAAIDSLRREVIYLTAMKDPFCMPEENCEFLDSLAIPAAIDSQRAELESISAALNQFDASMNVIESKKFPLVAATAGYRYGRPGLNGNSDDFMGYFIAGVQIRFNLFDGFKTSSQSRQAALNKDIIKQNREGSIDAWNNVLANCHHQNIFLKEKIEAAQLSIEAARSLVQSSKEQFDAGQLTQIEYLNALDNDAVAELRLEQARFERRLIILTGIYISGKDLTF